MNDRITDQAIQWHFALEGDDADWDGFTRWLESDSRHRLAYDQIALMDDLLSRHRLTLSAVTPMAEKRPFERRAGRLALGGLAAAFLAVLLVPTLLLQRPAGLPPQPVHYASAVGETRQVTLDDGTAIALAPASHLDVADRGRALSLAGAAAFDVPHRIGRELVVHAGNVDIVDIGTRFEVTTAPDIVRIRVAEGRLSARLPDGQRINVTAGKRLLVDTARGSAELAPLGNADFADWRHGRLSYEAAPLALVAADVARHSGIEVRIDRDIASRRFSGILTIGNGSGLVRNLAQIMDLDVRPEGKAVRLAARGAGRGKLRPAG